LVPSRWFNGTVTGKNSRRPRKKWWVALAGLSRV
jgi:hypothetical protein